jgi:hypothetical protein
MTASQVFGDIRGWIALCLVAAVGHYFFGNLESSEPISIYGSIAFSITNVSPFMVATAFGRARAGLIKK